MLRVAEHFEKTDTGRQRRSNEDSFFARSPLFVVADGMGGARAGEVASRIAVEAFEQGLPDGASADQALTATIREANERIFDLAGADRERAGMGTTLTAAYVGERDVTIAAPLLPLYQVRPGRGRTPAVEAMVMKTPLRFARMCGTACRAVRNRLFTLTA